MLGFKNVSVYKIKKEIDLSNLEEALDEVKFTGCNHGEGSSSGFATPLKGGSIVYQADNAILLSVMFEDKILPSSVINEKLEERTQELEEKEGRKLQRAEKSMLKDDIISTLLPLAFSKKSKTPLFIDLSSKMIYIASASPKKCEEVLSLLRRALVSLPVVPAHYGYNVDLAMTTWLIDQEAPKNFGILDEAELQSTVDESVIKCKEQALDSQEVLIPLQSGKFCTKLGLHFKDNVSLVLTSDLIFTKLKFSDKLRGKNDDISMEDFAQRFDADFILLKSTLISLVESLMNEIPSKEYL